MGYDQMEDGGPFCLMVAAVSRQQDQWQQDHWQRSTTDQQPGDPRSEDGGQQLAAKQHPIWERRAADCQPGWGLPWPSKRWRPSWRDWYIACCASGCNISTKGQSSTRTNTENYRLSLSSGKLLS